MKKAPLADPKPMMHEVLLDEIETRLNTRFFTTAKEGEAWLLLRVLKTGRIPPSQLESVIKRVKALLKTRRCVLSLQELLDTLQTEYQEYVR